MVENSVNYEFYGKYGPGIYCTCGEYILQSPGEGLSFWAKQHIEITGHKWRTPNDHSSV